MHQKPGVSFGSPSVEDGAVIGRTVREAWRDMLGMRAGSGDK